MTSLAATADLALSELDACRGVLLDATVADWARPTRCGDWDLEALGRHLAAVAWQQAEAFHRARVHLAESPSWLQASGDVGDVLDLLSSARQHLAGALDAVVGMPDATVPLPFAPLPTPIATAALVLEYGVHRADLERALGRATDVDLDADVARVVAALLPLLVPVLAEKAPAEPVTYRLTSPAATVAVSWRDDAWHAGEGDGPICELRGSDAAIALLALGRIAADHPALDVSGDPRVALALSDHIRPL